MIRRPFGQTGLQVSPLALGTVKLGRTRGLKHAKPFAIPDDAAAARLIALAAELGVNMLDTAPAYGVSEERLGKLLAGRRHDWVICTKAGEEFEQASGTSRFDFSERHIRFSVERSLRRLRTDVLDVVLVHSDGNDNDIIRRHGALATLQAMKTEGKLRACGMSSKTVEGGLLSVEEADCAMVSYNLAQRDQLPVIDRARELGRGILVKKPLASGALADGSAGGEAAPALAAALSYPGVSAVVVGTIDPGHLAANVRACEQALGNEVSPGR